MPILSSNNRYKRCFLKVRINNTTLTSTQKLFLNEKGYLILPPTKFIRENLKQLNKVQVI